MSKKRVTELSTAAPGQQPPAQPALGAPEVDTDPAAESVNDMARAAKGAVALPHRTDAGNAELFARLNHNNLRYDHHRQRWLVWRKHWWAEDTDGGVLRIAKSVVRARRQIALTTMTGDDLEAELKWAMRSEARMKLEAMLALAKSEAYLANAGQQWDSDPWLLGVANGVVDLRTGLLRPGRQKDLITMHTGVPFEPKAQAPRWMKFLNETFDGSEPLIELGPFWLGQGESEAADGTAEPNGGRGAFEVQGRRAVQGTGTLGLLLEKRNASCGAQPDAALPEAGGQEVRDAMAILARFPPHPRHSARANRDGPVRPPGADGPRRRRDDDAL